MACLYGRRQRYVRSHRYFLRALARHFFQRQTPRPSRCNRKNCHRHRPEADTMSAAAGVPCVLCAQDGGRLIWRNDALRVIDVGDPDLPGYTRVIWQTHVREMTDLTRAERTEFMEVVYLVESMQRHWLKPDKINIASLGNQTPHLHWHIMPRWKEDPWFPDSIWAARR